MAKSSVWAENTGPGIITDARNYVPPMGPPPDQPSVWATSDDQMQQLPTPAPDVRGPKMQLSQDTINRGNLADIGQRQALAHTIDQETRAYQAAHPTEWKELDTAHKIGRVFSTLGNVAGNIVAPNVMANIPGTEMYNREREGQLAKRLDTEVQHEAENKEREAQGGYLGAETATKEAELPYVGPEKEAEMRQKNAMASLWENAGQQNPDRQRAFSILADPNASEADRRWAASQVAQDPMGMISAGKGMQTGARDLFNQGEVGSRVGGGEVMPDPNSPTGYSKVLRDHMGNVIGTQYTQPTSANLLAMGPQKSPFIGGQANLAGSKAAAIAAQGLVPIIDPKTNQEIGYLPKGSIAGATGAGQSGLHEAAAGGLTPKPTGATTSGAQAADTLQAMVQNNILPAIDEANAAGDMGPGAGTVEKFLLRHIGNPDSPAARLQAKLDAVGPMLGRMYGFRSADYAEAQNNFLSTQMTPEALRGYLDGVVSHARTVAQQGGMGREFTPENAPTAQPLGTTSKPDGNYEKDGKKFRVKGGQVYAR